MPPDYFASGATLPSGAELYQSAQANWAASQAAVEPTATATPATPPPEELYAPYRARKGITFDVYAEPGKPQTATLDDILNRREEFADWQVTVKDKTGERKGIAIRDMDQALAEGFQLEGSHETRTHEFVEEHKGLKGDALVAARNFADELFLGIPGVVDQHTKSPQDLANLEALKNDHELANAIGGVTGFAGSMLVGGPLFKGAASLGRVASAGVTRAAEKVLATRLAEAGVETGAKALAKQLVAKSLGSAAALGSEAAVIVAPKAVTELALGDPDAAAETMLWSMGAGAALGVVGPAAKELFGRAAGAVFKTSASIPGKVDAYASEQALKSHNPYLKFSQRLTEIPGGEQAAGKVVRDLGLVRRAGENFEELGARIADASKATGEGIEAIYTRLDAKGVSIDPKTVAQNIRSTVLEPLASQIGLEARANKIAQYLETFEAKTNGAPLKPTDLLAIRRTLDEKIFGEKLPAPDQVDKYLKSIRDLYKKTLDDKVESELGFEAKSQLHKLNLDYRVLSILEKNAQKNVGRVVTNRTLSLTDYLTGGGLASAGALAGGMVAGPGGAAIGAGAGKLVGMLGNKYLRENYNQLAVQGADKLGVLFAEQAVRRSAKELDRVPAMLERMSGAKAVVSDAVEAAPVRALTALFGSQGSRAERYEHAAEFLDGAMSDMEGTSQKVGDLSGALAEGGAPTIAASFTAKSHAALTYLQQTMPRASGSALPSLFGPKTKYVPSERELHAWERRAEIVAHPFAAFQHLETGTLTREHVEALDAVYPSLAGQLRERIALHAADPKAPVLSSTARGQVSLLLGTSPQGGKSMRRYQDNYGAPEEGEKPAGNAGGGRSRGPKLDKLPSMETPTQRITAR